MRESFPFQKTWQGGNICEEKKGKRKRIRGGRSYGRYGKRQADAAGNSNGKTGKVGGKRSGAEEG